MAAFAFAIAGGVVAVALLLDGFSFGAPALGLAVTLGMAGGLAAASHRAGAWMHLLGYSLAFVLLSWPVLVVLGISLFPGRWE